MREPLPICTDLILAFDNENAAIAHNPVRFFSCGKIQFKHGLMIFSGDVLSPIVPVIFFVILMTIMRRTPWRVHVWWVQHHAIYCAAIYALFQICWQTPVRCFGHASPEHPATMRYVCDFASRLHVS